MDTLTIDDLEVLRGKFAASEHEFTRGYAYITESAITTRLEQVDPAWRFELLNTAIRGDKVTVVARLTVKGVSRDGVGMQDILTGEKKDKGGNVIGIYETGEPEKGAATDALKRCARLFGVGRYLLDLPGHVKDERTLAAWLDAPVQAPAQANPRVDAATKAKLGSGEGERRIPQSPPARKPQGKLEIHVPKGALWDVDAVKAQTIDAYEGNQWEQANSINKMIAAGDIKADFVDKHVVKVVLWHCAYKRFGLTEADIYAALSAAQGDDVAQYRDWKQDGKAAWQAIVAYKENDPFAGDVLPKTGTEG